MLNNKLAIAIMGMFASQVIGIIATMRHDLDMLYFAAIAAVISAVTALLPKDL